MTSPSDVDRLRQQTRQYEFSDGLRDLQLAIMLGVGGAVVWLVFEPIWMTFMANLVKTLGRWAAWLGVLAVILAPLTAWGTLRVMDFLRRRWLWRQSGIVKPSRWVVSRRLNVLSAIILFGGLAIGVGARLVGWVDNAFVLRMIWVATGWSFGLTTAGVGRDLGLSRYVWLGAIGGTMSTFLLFLPLTFSQTSLVFGLSWFLLLTASGVVTLRRAVLATKTGNR